jgi:uncharacterized protein
LQTYAFQFERLCCKIEISIDFTGDLNVKDQLEKLVELQITDTNIRKLQKSIETADSRRAEIEQEFERHASSIREIQGQAETAKLEKVSLEKSIAETKSSLERAERNLKNSQNQKEYEAAMRETDVLQKQIAALETQVLEKMNAVEEVEKTLADRAEEIAGLEGNHTKELGKFESELTKTQKEFDKESAKREVVFKTLPPNLASIYNRMVQRSRDGIAVAEVKNDSCSSCFIKLRPQKVMEIKRYTEIVTCENCTRILYILTKTAENA